MKKLRLALLIGFSLLPLMARAIQVNFTTVDLGGDRYRYDYTIVNDGSLGPSTSLGLIDLLFDPALYEEASLTNVSASALAVDWDQQFLASAPSIPAAFDLMAKGSGLPAGSQIGGFAVEFTWLGSGAPAAQPFEVYDQSSFSLLAQGVTSPVPEADAWLALLVGLPILAGRYRRRSQADPAT